ncbi:MAG: tetratricopeptide repeat protein [Nitrospirales bacterium]
MAETESNYETAESLRKNKQFVEAIKHFAVLWEQNPSAYIGWRYAHCLRKTGRLEDAENVARLALEKYPQDKYTKSELGWVLYDKELKPAKEETDLGRAVHFANEIILLNPDLFALNLVASAVMKVAKSRSKWDIVLEWASKLEATNLSNEPRMFSGKRSMSERETWYVSRARALLELERYDEARVFAHEGIEEFPDELFLARTAALALARSGNVQDGADGLRQLLTHRRADWYVKADLAEMEYHLGNHVEAYRLMCEAVSNQQDDEYKLGYFVTLGRISVALNRFDIAAEHVELARSVRINNNWSIPADLMQLEEAVQDGLSKQGQVWPVLPKDLNKLSRICQQRWKEGANAGLEFVRGTLGAISPNRPFAFIKQDEGGEDVFVIVKHVPTKCAREGARLEFTLKNSYDKKKNRESLQAANIRCLKVD